MGLPPERVMRETQGTVRAQRNARSSLGSQGRLPGGGNSQLKPKNKQELPHWRVEVTAYATVQETWSFGMTLIFIKIGLKILVLDQVHAHSRALDGGLGGGGG